jgi:ADP-ribose pyrophosphatase YjhB (NUDIX family)
MAPDFAELRLGRQHSGVSERQRVAVYGVCVDEQGRLLLARAAPSLALRGRWFRPGGGVQHGESPTDALRREIEEESGLHVELGELLDVLSDVRTLPDGTSLHTVRVIYRVASWSGSLRAERDGTTDAVRWVTREELSTLPLAFYVRDVVERLL